MPKQCVVKSVKIDDVQPESVTGKDILSPKGQVILRKGVKLTSSVLEQLKRRGISHVLIETEEDEAPCDPKALEEIKRKADMLIERKFHWTSPDNRLMMGLKEVFRKRLMGKIASGS